MSESTAANRDPSEPVVNPTTDPVGPTSPVDDPNTTTDTNPDDDVNDDGVTGGDPPR